MVLLSVGRDSHIGSPAVLFRFMFCLFKDRDALRSERFSLRKMEIEKGLYGDSDLGLIQRSERETVKGHLLNSESMGEGV